MGQAQAPGQGYPRLSGGAWVLLCGIRTLPGAWAGRTGPHGWAGRHRGPWNGVCGGKKHVSAPALAPLSHDHFSSLDRCRILTRT